MGGTLDGRAEIMVGLELVTRYTPVRRKPPPSREGARLYQRLQEARPELRYFSGAAQQSGLSNL